jgi:ABC-2 type transport system permease protein
MRLHQLWSFLVRDYRTEVSYRFSFILNLSGILFSAFTFFYISQLIGEAANPYLQEFDGDYFSFVIIGIAFSGYFGVGLTGYSRALREAQTTGTLEAMIMTPLPMPTLVIGSALWSYVMTTLRVFVFLLLGVVVFGLDLSGANALAALVILLLSIVAFASIGIIAAGIIMIIKRGEPLTSLFGAFANLVGGIYYPVAILPEGLQFVARLIPITYAVRGMRLALLNGASWPDLLPDIAALLIFIVVLFPLALLVFRWSVERARVDGSLAHY